MTRIFFLPMVGALPLALSGCVAGMAVSAVSMAARAAQGQPTSNEALKPQALGECSKRAAQFGAVHIIDVEQHAVGKIIVWGTVKAGTQKRSFKCDYATRITGFKLSRPLP